MTLQQLQLPGDTWLELSGTLHSPCYIISVHLDLACPLPLKKNTHNFENVQNAFIKFVQISTLPFILPILLHTTMLHGILYKLTMELPPLLEYRKEYLLFEHKIDCSITLFSFLNGSLINRTTFIQMSSKVAPLCLSGPK